MSTTPGALEIVREAFDRMRTPVAVDVPPSREERAAAWGRLTAKLVNWSVPTDDPAFTGFDPAKAGSEQSFVFRTKLPESVWRDLTGIHATPYYKRRTAQGYLPAMVEDIFLQPMVDRTLAVIERRMADMKAQLATLTEAYDRRGQTIRELYEERDRAQAQLAAFTAQNVRPPDEKPEPAPIFRAIAPSRTDPRRLGLA